MATVSTRLLRRLAPTSKRLARDRRGAITIEVAWGLSFFGLLLVGATDFGLAFTEKMEMTNTVRAGTQFALMRHPSLSPSTQASESVVSIQDIRNAIVNSSRFLQSDPGTDALNVCIYYECPGDPPTACTTTTGSEPVCAEWKTYLQVSYNRTYTPLFDYPGISSEVPLNATHVVRLN